MAEQGHAIACTLHQPRQAIVDMFDNVAFMSAGRLVYLGPPRSVQAWLNNVGLWDPDQELGASLCDTVLDCITVGFDKPEALYGRHTLRDEAAVEQLAALHRQQLPSKVRKTAGIGVEKVSGLETPYQKRPGLLRQYWTLQKQQFRIAIRSASTLAARAGLHCSIGLLFGTLYYDLERSFFSGAGGWGPWLPVYMQRASPMPKDRVGFIFMLALAQQVTPNCAMSFFIEDKHYYIREAPARLYGAVTYHLANAITEAMVCTVNAALASWVATSMAGLPLSGRWHLLMLHMVSHHMCSSAMVQMCGRLTQNQDVAFVLSAGYIILNWLFSNVLVKIDTVSPPLAALSWLCSLFYCVGGLVQVEFAGVEERGLPLGDAVVSAYSIRLSSDHALDQAGCLMVVWGFYVLFSTTGFLALKFRSMPRSDSF